MTHDDGWTEHEFEMDETAYGTRKEAVSEVNELADMYFADTDVAVGVGSTQFNSPTAEQYVAVEGDSVEVEVYGDRVRARKTQDDEMTTTDDMVLAFAYGAAAGPTEATPQQAADGYDDFVEDVDAAYDLEDAGPDGMHLGAMPP